MKKIVYSTLFFAGMFLTTACSDYLEVGSPSIVDSDFVFSNPTTARAALDGAYEQWRDCAQNKVFGDGLFYAADIAGSDIERHPESFSNQQVMVLWTRMTKRLSAKLCHNIQVVLQLTVIGRQSISL